MMIGVDFDNTIVAYDDLFATLAHEERLLPPDVAPTKVAIRDHLRSQGREDEWTRLQGIAYGPRLCDAVEYPGAGAFFRACHMMGIAVRIISHKTTSPYLGPDHDLHDAADRWLKAHGLLDPDVTGLRREAVYFEPTKEAKLQRISTEGCTHFIDDLPEFLGETAFPSGVTRILFDPAMAYRGTQYGRVSSWAGASVLLGVHGE